MLDKNVMATAILALGLALSAPGNAAPMFSDVTASVYLADGALNADMATTTGPAGEAVGNAAINDIGNGSGTGGLLGRTANESVRFFGPVDFGSISDFQGTFGALVPGGNLFNVFATLFSGVLTVDAGTTSLSLGLDLADDAAVIYLDLDQDGIFETGSSEAIVGANFVSAPAAGSVSITPGEYRMAVAHWGFNNTFPSELRATIDVNGAGQPGVLTAVPEPASVALLGLGLVALTGAGRRRSRQRR